MGSTWVGLTDQQPRKLSKMYLMSRLHLETSQIEDMDTTSNYYKRENSRNEPSIFAPSLGFKPYISNCWCFM